MALIKDIYFEDKSYRFVTDNYKNDIDNTFTVIIGNNGTGKSRFLSHVIKEVWKKSFDNGMTLLDLNITRFSKIIALTSSPFDKFPSIRIFNRYMKRKYNDTNINNQYKYLGLKDDLHKFINSNGQLFKIIDSLLFSTNKSNNELRKLAKTFNLLGYQPQLLLVYEFKSHFRIMNLFHHMNTYEEFFSYMEHYEGSRPNSLMDQLTQDKSLFYTIKESIEQLYEFTYNREMYFEIDILDGIFIRGSHEHYKRIQILRDFNLVEFKNLHLWKTSHDDNISIKDTSSGERALLLNILGIASEIQDDTLICIDEPEISLHPEWQEKYMQLLTSTFKNYQGCHFVIATHSPKIISELSLKNCFILSMDNNHVYSSENYAKRSSDYQLARLFKTPGSRNEYLLKECVKILSTLSKTRTLSDEDHNSIRKLIELLPKLEDEDPVKEMILIIEETLEKLYND
ncbi:ATP-binding protein [Sulfurovum sp. XTW-4]|uniref:ATP-binding protein n=1 Tax=Sulfurovum xiamenensis TaxID=3019066 RepID=A0ABT7QU76_9BACT|nr:ATP-binding protein [Sulfurovum xiamenensis]MDM5264575.1 ATP-binding protein [Sulfurovum xiamenensis]